MNRLTPWAIATAMLFCAPVSASDSYGPVREGEVLSRIAIQFRPAPHPLSTCRTSVAIYWLNPTAFHGSIHRLKRGASIRVPSKAQIESVPLPLAVDLCNTADIGIPSPSPEFLAASEGRSHARSEQASNAVAATGGGGHIAATIPRSDTPAQTSDEKSVAPTEGTVAAPILAAMATSTESKVPRVEPVETAVPAPVVVRDRDAQRAEVSGADGAELADRRRPGEPGAVRPRPAAPTINPNANTDLLPVAPPPQPWQPEAWTKAPVPDRWRILNALDLVPQRWYDPYNQNTWKGDKPIRNGDEFLILSAIFDGIAEPRKFPQPVGAQSTTDPGSTGIFGGFDNTLYNANLIFSAVYLKGDTTFRPPDWEYHFLPVISLNYARNDESRVLGTDPRDGAARSDVHIGLQELFADYHLRNVGERYDFDSFRIGIQPFSSDFRGFLFQDNQLMVRYFGNRDNNRWQFNLAYMRRLEKDTNSLLNDVGERLRDDDTVFANLYRQDWPVLGFTSQAIVAYNRNSEDGREDRFFNTNGFIERPASLGTETPRGYDLTYLGYNGDGHFGRLNLTVAAYLALGEEDRGVFTDRSRDIRASFAAAEASVDQDWIRWRLSGMYQSGDDDPFDDEANGFDAIFENPTFAGADTSFWFRQAVPLIGGGIVNLSQRNGLLNNLRTSKEHGQSNFANPGLLLVGVGNDLDLTPQVRLSTNANHLWFDDTATLEVARNQTPIDREIGWDLSAALIWRPFFQQNVVFRLSGAYLLPGDGFKDLYPDEEGYSVLGNLILTY